MARTSSNHNTIATAGDAMEWSNIPLSRVMNAAEARMMADMDRPSRGQRRDTVYFDDIPTSRKQEKPTLKMKEELTLCSEKLWN